MARFSENLSGLRFVHRFNEHADQYDSICTTCARAVGSSTIEAELLDFESEHKCRGGILLDFARSYEKRRMKYV
ncbi:hypothetical protein HNQ77_001245 [Silvibacterium bohemicum]|uniref:Uncharacterized protein n=1 Tax=Silvibacterium bohemicum TaxID=1577686 RepID=A0A841JWE8_9BACT|nr:hypothetical protein [Silvibacterium bohemicum]MBB6143301.1 hypothetical protein [Silvibacterium bohemicum]